MTTTPPADDGLTFYATIETSSGEQLHRETPNRADLVEWIAVHQPGGRLVSISMEATSEPAMRNMLAAILFGAERMAGR